MTTPADKRRIEESAQDIAQRIGAAAEQVGCLFAVLFFQPGSGGWATYVSNANRGDMIKALREQANHLELGIDVPPQRSQH
jgi:hypothetical protein